jgi:hypothetical protein
MSLKIFEAPTMLPSRFLIGETVRETGKEVPSFLRRTVS